MGSKCPLHETSPLHLCAFHTCVPPTPKCLTHLCGLQPHLITTSTFGHREFLAMKLAFVLAVPQATRLSLRYSLCWHVTPLIFLDPSHYLKYSCFNQFLHWVFILFIAVSLGPGINQGKYWHTDIFVEQMNDECWLGRHQSGINLRV